jgi:hypothetical protein
MLDHPVAVWAVSRFARLPSTLREAPPPPRREDGVCDGEWTAVRGLGGRAVSSDGARSSVLSELIGRELAMLRAAAAGRGEFLCGSEPALAIDVYWCDFSLRAPPGTRGVAAPGRARRPGERVSAEITPAGRLGLASGLSGVVSWWRLPACLGLVAGLWTVSGAYAHVGHAPGRHPGGVELGAHRDVGLASAGRGLSSRPPDCARPASCAPVDTAGSVRPSVAAARGMRSGAR